MELDPALANAQFDLFASMLSQFILGSQLASILYGEFVPVTEYFEL